MTRFAIAAILAVLGVAPIYAQLRAGAFAMDVTPEQYPISVNGGFADRFATKANDPLHARCLVFDDGKAKLALVVVDSCMLPRELVLNAKKQATAATGIPATHIMISATHTHTAPTSTGVFQSEPDAKYVAFLAGKIAAGIAKAHSLLAPSEVGFGVALEPNQVFNRRWFTKPGFPNADPFGGTSDKVRMNPGHQNPALASPAGPTDPEVNVILVRAAGGGRLLALFANYSLHYVGDLPPLSADYFGVFAGIIGGKIGADAAEPKFVGALSNGTSADVNNVNFREAALKTAPGERCRQVAEAVAVAAARAAGYAKPTAVVTLAAATADLELKVRKPTMADLERADGVLKKAGDRVLRTAEEVYARETVLIAKYPDAVPVTVQVLRIGGLGIAAIPCEVFTEIGLSVKRTSPLPGTFTVSLANGYNGYLPTAAQHALGGYETWRARSSYLEVGAADAITAKLAELFVAVGK